MLERTANTTAVSEPVVTWAMRCKIRKILDLPNEERSDSQVRRYWRHYSLPSASQFGLDPSAFGLPPKDYILHLVHVADFHLNSLYHFFKHVEITEQLNGILLSSLQSVPRVWRVRLLIIIALGKLFLEKGADVSGPPGIQEFLQSTVALPSSIELALNPIAAIETLSLLAVYAQAAELHDAAYLYVGSIQDTSSS